MRYCWRFEKLCYLIVRDDWRLILRIKYPLGCQFGRKKKSSSVLLALNFVKIKTHKPGENMVNSLKIVLSTLIRKHVSYVWQPKMVDDDDTSLATDFPSVIGQDGQDGTGRPRLNFAKTLSKIIITETNMGSAQSTTRKVSFGVDEEDRVRILRGIKVMLQLALGSVRDRCSRVR